jgi:hypothetical protein
VSDSVGKTKVLPEFELSLWVETSVIGFDQMIGVFERDLTDWIGFRQPEVPIIGSCRIRSDPMSSYV